MGWKAVKEHYNIEHNVKVDDGKICIGSGYIPDIITFDFEGNFYNRKDPCVWTKDSELIRLQQVLDADPDLLKKLIKQEDTFTASIPVYTYSGAKITEHFCEELGYPNVTHDGLMMYENSFTTDRNEAIEWALKNAESAVKWEERRLGDLQKEIEDTKTRRDQYASDVAALKVLSSSEGE